MYSSVGLFQIVSATENLSDRQVNDEQVNDEQGSDEQGSDELVSDGEASCLSEEQIVLISD